jgi:hypothetical protein
VTTFLVRSTYTLYQQGRARVRFVIVMFGGLLNWPCPEVANLGTILMWVGFVFYRRIGAILDWDKSGPFGGINDSQADMSARVVTLDSPNIGR